MPGSVLGSGAMTGNKTGMMVSMMLRLSERDKDTKENRGKDTDKVK